MAKSDVQIDTLMGWRAEVGLLAPWARMYREYEIVAPRGVRFSRGILGLSGRSDSEGFAEMDLQIEAEAKKLNMGHKCDLICLACTAGGFVREPDYDQTIIQRIEKASGSPATTTITCVLELFKDMGIKRIALVGPYNEWLFDKEIEFFKANGIKALYVKESGLGFVEQDEFWNYMLSPYISYQLAKDGAKAWPNADCVFVTCMASHILGWVDTLEEEIGKPVISSPSATLYGILKKLGISDPVYHYGQKLLSRR